VDFAHDAFGDYPGAFFLGGHFIKHQGFGLRPPAGRGRIAGC